MSKIFTSEKKVTKRNFILRILEILIVIVILMGIVFTYASKEGFIVFLGSALKEIVSPKIPVSSEEKTPKEKILSSISANLSLKEIRDNQTSLEIITLEDTKIIFSTEKDISNQINSLQTISEQAKIEGKKIKKIDLRYDKIIIEYK